MKKFKVKFTANEKKQIIEMYVKCDDINQVVKQVQLSFDLSEIRLIKEVPNDTIL